VAQQGFAVPLLLAPPFRSLLGLCSQQHFGDYSLVEPYFLLMHKLGIDLLEHAPHEPFLELLRVLAERVHHKTANFLEAD
jgi:hypothetical protein